jgi:hypothetical protein
MGSLNVDNPKQTSEEVLQFSRNNTWWKVLFRELKLDLWEFLYFMETIYRCLK